MPVLFGFVFGYLGSIPVAGPISVVVFTLGVGKKLRAGLAFSAGAALGEAIYACLALFGTAKMLERVPWLVPWSRGVGGVVIAVLGLYFLLRKPSDTTAEERRGLSAPGRAFGTGFGLAIVNPTFLFTWTAASATLVSAGIGTTLGPDDAPLVALGAAVGIVGWFGTMLVLLGKLAHRVTKQSLHRIEQGAGVLLLAIAAWFLVTAIRGA